MEGSIVRYNEDYGAMLVEITNEVAVYKFINRSGELIDSYEYRFNIPPVIITTTLADAEEYKAYSDTVEASDIDSSDAMTYSFLAAPSWMTIDSSSGIISGVPTRIDVGENILVSIKVDDIAGASDTLLANISVLNTIINLYVDYAFTDPGDSVTVDVSITNDDSVDISALEIGVNFDQTILTFDSTDRDSSSILGMGWLFEDNPIAP